MADTASSATRKEAFMERYKKFKDQKQQKQALKEQKNTQNLRNDLKRKSGVIAEVPAKKKPRNVESVVAQQWRDRTTETTATKQTTGQDKPNKQQALETTATKRTTGQDKSNKQQGKPLLHKQKPTTKKENIPTAKDQGTRNKWKPKTSNQPSQKRNTPMLVRLERWRAEKKKTQTETEGHNNRRTDIITPSTTKTAVSKYQLPGGPRALQSRYSMRVAGTAKQQKTTQHRQSLPASQLVLTSMHKTLINTQKQSHVPTNIKKSVENKYKANPGKSILKRRHSEVRPSTSASPAKRSGILKRKSCIASFVDNSQVDCPADNELSKRLGTDALNKSLSDQGFDTEDDSVFLKETAKTPDNARTVRFFSPGRQSVGMKCRKTPRANSHPAQQQSMRARLDDWLKAKGKTPSKFRHLMCFDADIAARKKNDPKLKCSLTVDELTKQQAVMEHEDTLAVSLTGQFDKVAEEKEAMDQATTQLETVLDECTILFEAGCPTEDILKWLDSIEVNMPSAKTSSLFYITKAKVLKSTTDLDRVLEVFEAAVLNAAQPAQELASALKSIVKEVMKEQEEKACSKLRKQQMHEENIFKSSSIKYCMRQVTPFTKRGRRSVDSVSTPGSHCTVITPVRRSTRRSLADLPESLQDKTPIYNTLEELSDSDKKRTLYQRNTALLPVMMDLSEEDDLV